MKMSDYYGAVSKCDRCTNWNPAKPMDCNNCFCRGYVAACLNCNGTGQVSEPVAGTATLQDKGAAMMKSTCNICGGKRHFACNKPADWDILHPEPIAELPAEVEAAAEPDVSASLTAVYEKAKDIPEGQKGWVQPPLRPTGTATA